MSSITAPFNTGSASDAGCSSSFSMKQFKQVRSPTSVSKEHFESIVPDGNAANDSLLQSSGGISSISASGNTSTPGGNSRPSSKTISTPATEEYQAPAKSDHQDFAISTATVREALLQNESLYCPSPSDPSVDLGHYPPSLETSHKKSRNSSLSGSSGVSMTSGMDSRQLDQNIDRYLDDHNEDRAINEYLDKKYHQHVLGKSSVRVSFASPFEQQRNYFSPPGKWTETSIKPSENDVRLPVQGGDSARSDDTTPSNTPAALATLPSPVGLRKGHASCSPSNSTVSSIETIDQEASDDYAPIDLTRARSDDLLIFKSLLCYDSRSPFRILASSVPVENDSYNSAPPVPTPCPTNKLTGTPRQHQNLHQPQYYGQHMIEHKVPLGAGCIDQTYPSTQTSAPRSDECYQAPRATLIEGVSTCPTAHSCDQQEEPPFQDQDGFEPFIWNWWEEDDHKDFYQQHHQLLEESELQCHNRRAPKRVSLDSSKEHVTPPSVSLVKSSDDYSVLSKKRKTLYCSERRKATPKTSLKRKKAPPEATNSRSDGTTRKRKKGSDEPKSSPFKRAKSTSVTPSPVNTPATASVQVREASAGGGRVLSVEQIRRSYENLLRATPVANSSRLIDDSKAATGCGQQDRKFTDHQNEIWMKHYHDAKEFHQRHSHCCIPHNYPDKPTLPRWAKRQRYQYNLYMACGNAKKMGSMNAERLNHLNAIGFVWNIMDSNWQRNFEELNKWARVHYTDPKTVSKIVPPKDSRLTQAELNQNKLFHWLKDQRSHYGMYLNGNSKCKLTPEKVGLLESIGVHHMVVSPPTGK